MILVVCIVCLVATTSFAKAKLPSYVYVPQPQTLKLRVEKDKVLDPDALVFSGGGASGVAYAGVLEYMRHVKKLENVKSYMGASAGAIFSLLFYLNYDENQIRDLYNRIKWKSFIECKRSINLLDIIRNFSWWKLGYNMRSILKALQDGYGLSTGNNIEHEMREIVSRYMGKEYKKGQKKKVVTTFAELKQRVKENDKVDKDLYVVAFSTCYYTTCFLSAKTTPDMDVVDAIRASMSIPLVFDPVKYKHSGHEDLLVDGGTTYNFPIEYMDALGANPVGFVLGDRDAYLSPEYAPVKSFRGFLEHVFMGLFDNIAPRMINNSYRTVFIDTPTVGVLDFDMTAANREKAVAAGYTAAMGYFQEAGPLEDPDKK